MPMDAASIEADIEADVVVVGGGGSGLAAAIEAARLGREVVIVEKNPQLGGSTGWSVGSISASGTPDQRRLGIADTADAHFDDMGKFAAHLRRPDNLALRHLLVENVTETVAWLRSLGVEFLGPFEEPPHRVPRMHIVLPTSRSYIWNLSRHVRSLGVRVVVNARADRILRNSGRVVGVEASTPEGARRRFLAHSAVVLAGGDYSGDPELKERFASREMAAVPAVNRTATGDCQKMVMEIGGAVLNGDLLLGPVLRFVPVPRRNFLHRVPPHRIVTRSMKWGFGRLPDAVVRPFIMSFMTTVLGPSPELFDAGALLVNRRGERLVTATPGDLGYTIARQPEQQALLVFDQTVAEKFSAPPHFISTAPGVAYAYLPDYRRNRSDLYYQAPDISSLAARLGMPESVLAASIAAHNDGLAAAAPSTNRAPIPPCGRPPFHALGPIQSYVVLTEGGVRVSPRLEVLDGTGTVIPGLFAAGSTGQGGLLLEGHGHHLGWAFTSGRIAGRHAATAADGATARDAALVT